MMKKNPKKNMTKGQFGQKKTWVHKIEERVWRKIEEKKKKKSQHGPLTKSKPIDQAQVQLLFAPATSKLQINS